MTSGLEGAAVKAVAGLAKPVGGWLLRRVRPDISRSALAGHADGLAEAVQRRETVLRDQLRAGPGTVMDLEFRIASRRRSGDDARCVLANIGTYYREKVTQRRLVVLGAAGAGKTVSAIHLVLDQLRDRALLSDSLRAAAPVPVRVNASGWDGSESFSGWLATRLCLDFALHARVARALIDSGRILPVLDGLDEMDPLDGASIRARTVLDRLNETPWRNRGLVVLCRTPVFARITGLRGDAGLHGATTVTVQTLTTTDIYCYLDDYRDQLGVAEQAWGSVTARLEQDPDGPLATALRTPWLLGLAAPALHGGGRDTADALAACSTVTAVCDLLFASMIPAAIAATERTAATRAYTERAVDIWLHNLAEHLQAQRIRGRGGTDITLDRIWELAGVRPTRSLTLSAFVLGGGLFYSTATGLLSGAYLIGETAILTWLWLWLGLWFGFWSVLTRFFPKLAAPPRLAWRIPGRSRGRRTLQGMLVAGAIIAFALTLTTWMWYFQPRGPSGAIAIAGWSISLCLLPLGVAIAVMKALGTTSEDRFALGVDEQRVIRDVRTAAIVVGLTVLLTVGILTGLRFLLRSWLVLRLYGIPDHLSGAQLARTMLPQFEQGLDVGLLLGLMLGTTAGTTIGLTAGRYAIASVLFRVTGTFAPRPAPFLNWARNTGLLRVTGISYQFRHDTYQQWLALRPAGRPDPIRRRAPGLAAVLVPVVVVVTTIALTVVASPR
ncbi:hypothetical protein [Nocardia sp. bgisy134]|uniref:hypothetical protein n=1 Tax=Nocardia sp. bgisy134 TaxID=3413789 RepID=UPI003D736736